MKQLQKFSVILLSHIPKNTLLLVGSSGQKFKNNLGILHSDLLLMMKLQTEMLIYLEIEI
jgi:hypothetical protein